MSESKDGFRIEDVDRNLVTITTVTEPDFVWYDVRRSPSRYTAFCTMRSRRISCACRKACSIQFPQVTIIFAGEDWDACTVDGSHPNDLGFFRYADHLEKYLRPLLS